jgi:hypothetical protein
MIDLWSRLQLIFAISQQVFPEIEIIDLREDGTREIADYLAHHMRGITARFRTFESDDFLNICTVHHLIDGVSTGDLIGAVSGELSIQNFILPELLFTFEEPGYLVLSYSTGAHWNPINLIALFEFFRLINRVDPRAKIKLSPQYFDTDWDVIFRSSLRAYLNG